MQENSQTIQIAGNTNTNFLKIIAMVAMVIDHIGAIFFPNFLELRVIGRLAFPLYGWCIVVGSVYTKNIYRYMLRLLLVGLISQPFYMVALHPTAWKLNIFCTLLFGLCCIFTIQKKQYWGTLLLIGASFFLEMDYGYKGVLFICLLYLSCIHRRTLLAFMTAYCLMWGQGTMHLMHFFTIPLAPLYRVLPEANALFKIQTLSILALPLMLFPVKKSFHIPKIVTYLFYPVHLLLLYLLGVVL